MPAVRRRVTCRTPSGSPMQLRQLVPAAEPAPAGGRARALRSQVRHDLNHELGIIMLLADALATADDVGPASRARVAQILVETRWLDRLLRAYDEGDRACRPERIQVDPVAGT